MAEGDNIEVPTECDKSCKDVEVPSKDEVKALNSMRSIKDRVRALKKRKSTLFSSRKDENQEELLEIENEMVRLKAAWIEWEAKRKEAARERMILLGHGEVS